MRRQKPVQGGRAALPACVLKEIQREVSRIARKFNVSRSFVVATALGEALGIEVEPYYEPTVKPRIYRVK